MKLSLRSILFLFALSMAFIACEKDDPVIIVEEELITTLKYTLTPILGGTSVVLNWQDLDGDGGAEPVIMNGVLEANTVYQGQLEFWNEAEDPAENITIEVFNEADEHQVFFESSDASVTVSYSDTDTNNFPVGLLSSLATGVATSFDLRIILQHEPEKDAVGVSDGNIANAGGTSDIDVTFTIDVQ